MYTYNPLSGTSDPEIDKTNPETGYRVVVYDGAKLLSQTEIKQLSSEMTGITEYGNVAFVSTDENNYKDIMSYSTAVYEYMFGSASGTMLIIDMDTREISIYSDGALHRVVTDSYGYEISKQIKNLSEEKYVIKETTLYSAFTRMQKNGYIESYSAEGDSGKRRTYYRITDSGKQYYKDKCEEWNLTKEVIEHFIEK